ncbi:transporter substrate-binding domain-containing protein [uncultured Rhodospira sp.]|uniref:transporter substrate-binding domain-containing protein n=1 Tax=uncultured Rhodospira sp. TaxID=1936189 RepID=UPI0026208862|nr:transporter substrate-binding domain-containing protein [uncultured Rhodospira sp.]
MRFLLIALVALAHWAATPALAQTQTCGGSYTVGAGESLSTIAGAVYGDTRKWTVLHHANISLLGLTPFRLRIGDELRIPCLESGVDQAAGADISGGASAGSGEGMTRSFRQVRATMSDASDANNDASGEVVDKPGREVLLLTADDYKPFTDRSLAEGGLITGIVDRVMSRAPGVKAHRIDWINDWSSHLDPLLSNGAYDLGFPWLRPNCVGNPEQLRCKSFLFSEPMFEMLVLLFVDADDPIEFNEDADMVGKTLCRPDGYYTHDLDKDGRNWLADGLITLKQPESVDDCFQLLLDGEVDAVALNEFTGREAILRLEIMDAVTVNQTRPLSIEGLYVLAHRDHPWASDLIAAVNEGLAQIKASGVYNEIVDRHLSAFWEKYQ